MINCFFDHPYDSPAEIAIHLNEGNDQDELRLAVRGLAQLTGLKEVNAIIPGRKWILTRKTGIAWHKGLFDAVLVALGHPPNQKLVA